MSGLPEASAWTPEVRRTRATSAAKIARWMTAVSPRTSVAAVTIHDVGLAFIVLSSFHVGLRPGSSVR